MMDGHSDHSNDAASSSDSSVRRLSLVSPAVAIPCKRGYALRFVVLSTGKPVVLLLPYVYQTDVEGNTLQKWEFINKSLMSSHHTVEAELAA